MRLINGWDSNYEASIYIWMLFDYKGEKMDTGKLYFIKDAFYDKFKYCGLLENKEMVNGTLHGRPCCYMFKYKEDGLYWMIPVSSKIQKYQNQYQRSISKYGLCDNISFGYVLGQRRAFLPQNLFPVTKEYIGNIYRDVNTNNPITIPRSLMAELNGKARKKIRYNFQGKKFGMTDIVKIYNGLTNQEQES